MRKSQIIWVFFFLVFLSITYSIEDFQASAQATVNVCTLTNAEGKLYIYNTGNDYSEYTLRVEGSASPYVTLIPQKLSLMPGNSANIFLYYHFPKEAAGKYTLSINIRTSMGIEKVLSQEINAQVCSNNILLAHNFNQSTLPCLPVTYNFTLYNNGHYLEFYTLGIDRFSEYANLSLSPIILQPGKAQDFQLTLKPDCSSYGDYILNLFSNAQTSGVTTKVPMLLSIKPYYNYEIKTGNLLDNNNNKFNSTFKAQEPEYEVCKGDNKSIQIQLNNQGYIGNNFFYMIEGPQWGTAYGNVLMLNGYEKALTYLDVSPPLEAEKENQFVFTVTSQIGNEKKQKAITVKVKDCYGLSIELPQEVKLCNCISTDIPFTIRNTGNFKETINLSLEAQEFINLSITKFAINASTSKNFSLKATPPCELTGVNELKLKASNKNIQAEELLSFEVFPLRQCYDIKIKVPDTIYTAFAQKEVAIDILHNGIKAATYRVDIEGYDWLSSDIKNFSLKPSEKYSFNLISDTTNVSKGTYFANLNLKSDDVIYQKKLRFEVGKSPLREKISELFIYYRYWLYAGIILIIIIFLFILYLRKKIRVWKIHRTIKKAEEQIKKVRKTKKLEWWKIAVVLIIALLIIVGIAFYKNLVQYFFSFFIDYIWYIIAGLILLWVVIIIIDKIEKK